MSDLASVVGRTIEDKPVGWNKRDLLIYALGVGAKYDDYAFVYELDPNFAAIPTYPVVLYFKHDDQDVNLFSDRIKEKPIPGLPPLNPNRVVHALQSIEVLKSIPLVSGPGWKWKTRYTGVVENQSGIILTSENLLVSPTGEAYAKLYSSSFNLGAKATGKRFSKFIAGPHQGPPVPKDRKPDWVFQDHTTTEQAATFRLSGDYNGLHIDPSIGKAAGFGGIILHGLCSYGFSARAVIKLVGGNDPKSLRYFSARFTAPVIPGDKLETRIWEVGKGKHEGTTEVVFEAVNLRTGKVILGDGTAWVVKSSNASVKL